MSKERSRVAKKLSEHSEVLAKHLKECNDDHPSFMGTKMLVCEPQRKHEHSEQLRKDHFWLLTKVRAFVLDEKEGRKLQTLLSELVKIAELKECLPVPDTKQPQKTIVAQELGMDEKLPKSFVNLDSQSEYNMCTQDEVTLFMADFVSKQWRKYAKTENAKLTANYNGLMWWYRNPATEVPTFVDLKTPRRVYYKPERIVTGLSKFTLEQCPEARPFITSPNFDGMELIDLNTRQVTVIVPPTHWKEEAAHFYVGFQDGKFRA
ncbi:hypothetical protein CJU89_3605 [Yarrowia sp. B02]|nr:hypothetical protein CJU89_3605 [Yarrowia sp. B02]